MSDTPNLDALLVLTEQTQPHAKPKGLPTVLVKKQKQKSKDEQAREFRRAVWTRDKGCSRATGRPLVKSGTTDWDRLGEVDHSIPRSLAPELLYSVEHGLLLSKTENRLRKVVCPRAPEFKMFDYSGPADLALPQHFLWRDEDGHINKERWG
jgi:hypothetical protein